LAILDLDDRSSQPMVSACGRYVIAYNGEIYNFRDLRRQREEAGDSFRTTSDTEVILALFAAEGEAMLGRLRGMFALVIWDRVAKRAFAARDPYGIKPLYVAQTHDGVLLGSQVKALLASGLVSRRPDAHGQAGFWLLGSVPEPYSWYRDISALPAGHFTWIEGGRPTASRSWEDVSAQWRDAPLDRSALVQVRSRAASALKETVASHLVSDVPVGIFLSGGIDSGALAGLMVDAGARDVLGVTISFKEFAGAPQDEAQPAAQLASHYGIRHHIRTVTRDEFRDDLPGILRAMDQPSIDGVNTWFASKAVAELGLKVVVSGVGGDELFQGYSHFRTLPAITRHWRAIAAIPGVRALARVAADYQALRSGNHRWASAPEWARSLPGAWMLRRSVFSPADLPGLMGDDLAAEFLAGFEAKEWVTQMSGRLPVDPRLALGQIESTTYLRNQLLRDSDWASMAHSVELRTPLVDAFLLRELKPLLGSFRRYSQKRLLAEAPAKPLPKALAGRRKTGFGIPLQRWLRELGLVHPGGGDSRDWAKVVAKSFAEAR
jgi:asparagine synthase (glutamine-hydrolysing)